MRRSGLNSLSKSQARTKTYKGKKEEMDTLLYNNLVTLMNSFALQLNTFKDDHIKALSNPNNPMVHRFSEICDLMGIDMIGTAGLL